jgi:hypothetical protein
MFDVMSLVGIVFAGLSALVIDAVEDAGDTIVVRARTRNEPAAAKSAYDHARVVDPASLWSG